MHAVPRLFMVEGVNAIFFNLEIRTPAVVVKSDFLRMFDELKWV